MRGYGHSAAGNISAPRRRLSHHADRRMSQVPRSRIAHSTNLIALSLLADTDQDGILPPIVPYYIMKVGHVPLIPYRRPGAPEISELVGAHILRCRAVILQSLGPVVWDTSVSRAACVRNSYPCRKLKSGHSADEIPAWDIRYPRQRPPIRLSPRRREDRRLSLSARRQNNQNV